MANMKINRYTYLMYFIYFVAFILIFKVKTNLWLSVISSLLIIITAIITQYFDKLNKRFYIIAKLIVAVVGVSLTFELVFQDTNLFNVVCITISILFIHAVVGFQNK